MAQTPCIKRGAGRSVPIASSGSARLAGTVVAIGTTVVGIIEVDTPANAPAAMAVAGTWKVPKDTSDVTAGDALYWNATGDPYGGTAGSGCFTKTVGSNIFGGIALESAGATTGNVEMMLRSIDGTVPGALGPVPSATVAAGGTAQANANAISTGFTKVTGADDTAAIRLPAAAAGLVCFVKNVVANKILKVFPAAGDKINGAAANAVYNQAAAAMRTYVSYDGTDWYTDPETIA
jgi:hypothetical protein